MPTRRKFLKSTLAGGLGGIVASRTVPAYIKDLKSDKNKASFEEARQLQNEMIFFDAHNDTPVERVARGQNVSTLLQFDNAYQTDIPRMNKAGYDSGCFVVGDGVIANVWVTLEELLEVIEANPDKLLRVHSSKDIIHANETGKIGVLPSIEGIAKWIMGETDTLRMLYRNGVRWVSISHGEGGPPPEEVPGGATGAGGYKYKNLKQGITYLQGSRTPVRPCTPQERATELKNAVGLTSFGKEVLRVSNELGIVTDLAHINDRAFFDVLEHTTKPAAVSHTGVFSVCNHTRNLTDDQIKALAANGGVMGIYFVPPFLALPPEKATLDTYVKHIAYVADLVGVDHVGVGTDYDGGIDVLVPLTELTGVIQALMKFGFSKEEIRKIWGGNFLRILKQNIDGKTGN